MHSRNLGHDAFFAAATSLRMERWRAALVLLAGAALAGCMQSQVPAAPGFRFQECGCPPGASCAPCPPVSCFVLTDPPEGGQVTQDGHWTKGQVAKGGEVETWFVVGRSGMPPGGIGRTVGNVSLRHSDSLSVVSLWQAEGPVPDDGVVGYARLRADAAVDVQVSWSLQFPPEGGCGNGRDLAVVSPSA